MNRSSDFWLLPVTYFRLLASGYLLLVTSGSLLSGLFEERELQYKSIIFIKG